MRKVKFIQNTDNKWILYKIQMINGSVLENNLKNLEVLEGWRVFGAVTLGEI